MANAIQVQLLRSEVLNKRPDPTKLLPGQGAVNTNAAQPGLFFADDSGTTLFKVGPCSVGANAPNAGATGDPGQLGNTLGELWFDTSDSTLKVWDGSVWISCRPPVRIFTVDDISAGFDDVATEFALAEGGVGIPSALISDETTFVSLGGVMQVPGDSYSIQASGLGSKIVFTAPPSTGTSCDIRVFTNT
jgi:hypothetical protein